MAKISKLLKFFEFERNYEKFFKITRKVLRCLKINCTNSSGPTLYQLLKMTLFWMSSFFSVILISKIDEKLNLRIIPRNYAADPEIRFATKSILQPFRSMCPNRQHGSWRNRNYWSDLDLVKFEKAGLSGSTARSFIIIFKFT